MISQQIINIAQENPEILLFLAIAIGYFIGKINIKGFSLGTTASVLLAAMVLGQINISIPPILKNISFALFAFCIGYQVGPQFFGSLKKEGLNYIFISLVVALTGLATAIFLGKILHFDSGTTAGLFAGSMTQSAVIGTAQGAIEHLSISDTAKNLLNGNIVVAYAITYVFGTVGVIIFFKIIPKIIKINLKDEAKKLEEKMGSFSDLSENTALFSWSHQVGLRAYKAENSNTIGKTASDIEKLFLPARIAIDKIKRKDKLFDPSLDTIIEENDILIIAGKHVGLSNAHDLIGHEIDVSTIVEILGESLQVCLLNKNFIGKSLGELAKIQETHGVFVTKITRQGRELPILMDTVLNKCDIVHIVGAKNDIEKIAQKAGYPERPTSATDLVMVGIGCVLGTIIGMIVIPVAGIPITLSAAGGVLITGLICGWLRSLHPTFGQIPEGGQWLLNDLGLNFFIACIGLSSGKQALQALETNGANIFFAGVILALIPIIAGLIFGRYVLKMNPILLLGALTGARVIPPALNTLEEEAESNTLTLGFAAPFAFANVFLTIMGSVIINLM